MENRYDIIVAGGGHSGIESALAGARIGCSVLLITFTKNKIGYLSCNPAVGGVGKGQLVKEIDALGGEMAKITDNAGIQFRILNRSKGPAVWSSRAQVDRNRYMLHTQNIINKEGNIDVMEGEVTGIIVENNRIKGVETDGETILGKAVILTPGTFLNGKMHIDWKTISGGRWKKRRQVKNSLQT
jgi:tRNA uridine 5-carboxymethylaminomethyl modification enzyme